VPPGAPTLAEIAAPVADIPGRSEATAAATAAANVARLLDLIEAAERRGNEALVQALSAALVNLTERKEAEPARAGVRAAVRRTTRNA